MDKNLNYFMQADIEEVTETFPAPNRKPFLDENGNPIMLEARLVPTEKMEQLRKQCITNKVALDSKGKPIISGGKVVRDEQFDGDKFSKLLMVESLVYPNMNDEKLRKFHKVAGAIELPARIFRNNADYLYIMEQLNRIQYGAEESTEEEVEEAKKE